jgi:D-alanyl-lipoteichoic acid acyltransferase DltB (MBOAT superfamily)
MTRSTLLVLIGVLLTSMVASRVRHATVRQLVLLVASCAFYSMFGWAFLVVLAASSMMNFAVGSVLRRTLSVRVLWFGITLNVLLLAFFKYLPPGVDPYARYIVMPLGISFWTFQALSYLIDTYLEEELDPTLLEFCCRNFAAPPGRRPRTCRLALCGSCRVCS